MSVEPVEPVEPVESDLVLSIRAMREETYLAELAWAGYAAAVDGAVLRLPVCLRTAARGTAIGEAAREPREDRAQ
jgi:hypothetical protein